MKKMVFLGVIALSFVTGGCGKKVSDAEFLKSLRTTQTQGCADGLSANTKLSGEAAKNICTCAFEELIAQNPVKKLREIDASKDKAAIQALVTPIITKCVETEIAKAR